MLILTEVTKRTAQLPKIRMPEWPKLRLHRRLCNALEGYAAVVSLSYGAAIGLDLHVLERESTERGSH